MKTFLKNLLEGKTLSKSDARSVMELVLDGQAAPEQVGAFLASIQVRGETKEELLGFLEALDARSHHVTPKTKELFDTCGTGGDGSGSFNISTATALLLSASGVSVAKHGNRSVSSRSGSADVLEALGVPIDLSPFDAAASIDRDGFSFLFAPKYHPALVGLAPIRKALGGRAVFHLLGPLANPAPIARRIVGLFDAGRLPLIAEVLRERGEKEAMVVASHDGMDEISLGAPTKVAHLKQGRISFFEVTPADFGIEIQSLDLLKGGDAPFNARIVEDVLGGTRTGACLDVIVMNTSAALVTAGKADDFKQGVEIARETIRSGRASGLLERLRCGRE